MSIPAQQFPYVPRDLTVGQASMAPMLPLTLIGRRSIAASGLVDSGSAVNVLPYSLGVNFFLEFEVCFFRSRGFFELRPNRESIP